MHTQMTPSQLRSWFDSEEFQQRYHCDAPLGAWLDETGTHFALWAPTAQAVQLNLYGDGDKDSFIFSRAMEQGERGLWQYHLPQRVDGAAYDYDVTVDGVTSRTQDPYAKASGLNGQRSVVLDLRTTDPLGWEHDKPPAKPKQDVVYEIHVKDFSWDEHSGVPGGYRGKYMALTLGDTTLDGAGAVPTCLNHAKSLGATHIQLMPVYDYGSVDERPGAEGFNWGYDPINYNVPEGSYATDPYRGDVRIRELKQAIQAMHRQGFRVIMDVVYNHTYHLESCLFKTVPWYFYRQNPDGSASNGSGCGNELASERSMCTRYILDSVLYWAEEYHIDGFRFDLMGMLDTTLMNRIRHELDRRFGLGEKLLYGEPWAGGECHPRPGVLLAHKDHMKQLDISVGAFCDNTRDAIKGNVMDEYSRGFANGGGLDAGKLASCVRAWSGAGDALAAPSQCITYLSAHDDWTLWDKLVCTLDASRSFSALTPRVLQANRLAIAMLMGCQGRLFMLSGEEFGRTKQGIKNSYCSPVEINRMDWQRCSENQELVEYYRGLIALRQQLPALWDQSATAGERILEVHQLAADAASILLDNSPDPHRPRLLLIYNASDRELTCTLPEGRWNALVDGESSTLWQSAHPLQQETILPPMSALIAGEENA